VTRTFYVRTRVGSRLNGGADERTQVNTSTLKPPGLRPRNVQHLDRVAIGLDAPHAPLLGGLSQAMSNGLVKATAMDPTKARMWCDMRQQILELYVWGRGKYISENTGPLKTWGTVPNRTGGTFPKCGSSGTAVRSNDGSNE